MINIVILVIIFLTAFGIGAFLVWRVYLQGFQAGREDCATEFEPLIKEMVTKTEELKIMWDEHVVPILRGG